MPTIISRKEVLVIVVGTVIALLYTLFISTELSNITLGIFVTSFLVVNTMLLMGLDDFRVFIKNLSIASYRNLCLSYFWFVILPFLVFNILTLNILSLGVILEFLVYIVIPTFIAILLTLPRFEVKSRFLDLALILFFIYYFDSRAVKDIFAIGGDSLYPIMSIYMVNVAIFTFFIIRHLTNIGFSYEFEKSDLKIWFQNIAILTVVLIPLGLVIDFIRPKTTFENPIYFILYFIGIFLTIATVEEIAFRGILLNVISKILDDERGALVISSIIFGFSHYNNSAPGDFRYVFLATIAGIFYGLSYLKEKRLLPAILVHTSVDTIWKYFFD